MGRRVTSADVAREAGVSRGTVSNVLNGDPRRLVRSDTKARVLAAVERLGYAPSAEARILRGGRARTVLVLLPHAGDAGHEGTAILDGLARALADRGMSMVWQVGPDGPRSARDLSPALVLTGAEPHDAEFAAVSRGFRVPVLPAFPGRDGHIAAAATAQAEHAKERGVRTVVYAAPADPALRRMSALRSAALRRAAARLGLEVGDDVVVPAERRHWAGLVASCVRAHADPVMACAYDDDTALAIQAGAFDSGCAVPTDLLVVGADDSTASYRAVPPLSTVRTDVSAFVERMAHALEVIADGGSASLPELPTDLRVLPRRSTTR